MRREVQADDIELGTPLKSALVDELGFPVADEDTVFYSDRERFLVLRAGRCFWADDMAPLRSDDPSSTWHDRYGLLVGTLLHVKRPGEANRAAVSRLIGFNESAAFIAWPSLAGKAAEISDGETLLFRGFTGTSIHSFSARVHATSRTPFPYLMLSDIAHVEAREMRGSIRVPVRLVGKLSIDDESLPPQTVLITDLSIGGASVSTATSSLATPGRQVRLEFTLRAGGMKSKFSLDGWTREDPDAQPSEPFHNVGVAFDGYGEREALLLRLFVHEQLLESATMRPGGMPK
ncbi:flagellar brake domain-containing protein [Cupriavidus sp. TMH.W2]|uniref:flagellar brake domain-containing protein n=1 Tax=Cupriavidus sp. TMH.W2 TaxID=3434465 RepID=UPI003D76B239